MRTTPFEQQHIRNVVRGGIPVEIFLRRLAPPPSRIRPEIRVIAGFHKFASRESVSIRSSLRVSAIWFTNFLERVNLISRGGIYPGG